MKKRFLGLVVLLLFVGLFSAQAATVSNANYFKSLGGHIEIHGTGDWVTTTAVVGTGLTAWCYNNGGNTAPGQNRDISINIVIPIKLYYDPGTGKYYGDFDIHFRDYVSWDQAGCPNSNWWVDRFIGTLWIKTSLYDAATGKLADEFGAKCFYSDATSELTCSYYNNPKW